MYEKNGGSGNAAFAVFVILLSLLIGAFGWIAALKQRQETSGTELKVVLQGEQTSETLAFESLCLQPSESVEYALVLQADEAGRYALSLSFQEKTRSELQAFLTVELFVDGERIDGKTLQALFDGEIFEREETFSEKQEKRLTVRYIMPREVGNEAQGASATFTLLLSAVREK